MEKELMSIRIQPDTREKLVAMREATGMSYGVLIDVMVRNAKSSDFGLVSQEEDRKEF